MNKDLKGRIVYFVNNGFDHPVIETGKILSCGPDKVVISYKDQVFMKYYDQIILKYVEN